MRLIDLCHLGREHVIGSYVVDGVIIDPGPSSCLPALLEGLGEEVPRALLLTHIHLDHAGATGSLVRRWPHLEVYVHDVGAPHLVDPTRLLESARRLYGDDMDRLWGEFLAVPESRIRALHGGERLLDGAFQVAYTPGHASHHVAYLHDSTAFVGDVGGVRIDGGMTIAPTPPPEVDIEAWHGSLGQLAQWAPERLAITHFGVSDDVAAQLEEVGQRLQEWAGWARDSDQDEFVERVRETVRSSEGAARAPAYFQAAPPEQLHAGLSRYWRKREA